MPAPAAFKPMSKNDVADVLGVSLRTIENWVNDGTLPAPSKLGNRCYWHPVAFYAWLDRRLLGDATALSAPADAAVLIEQVGIATPAPTKAPSAKKKQASPRASSVDRMRAKDQAALQALMA